MSEITRYSLFYTSGDDVEMEPYVEGEYVKYEDVADAIADMSAKLTTADALVTCCCGNPVDTHGMGDGHSPVDMYHHHMLQIEAENFHLRTALNAMLSAVCGETGFANAVRTDTNTPYPWDALDIAEELARSVLSSKEPS